MANLSRDVYATINGDSEHHTGGSAMPSNPCSGRALYPRHPCAYALLSVHIFWYEQGTSRVPLATGVIVNKPALERNGQDIQLALACLQCHSSL